MLKITYFLLQTLCNVADYYYLCSSEKELLASLAPPVEGADTSLPLTTAIITVSYIITE